VTIEDRNTVDSISVSEDGKDYELLMTEERLFEDSDLQFEQLEDKINAYIDFIQLGQLYEQYPQARGHELKVCLVCRNEPVGERFRDLLNTAARLFDENGVEFYIEVIPDELLGLAPN
jgi:hypothetical protein